MDNLPTHRAFHWNPFGKSTGEKKKRFARRFKNRYVEIEILYILHRGFSPVITVNF
jgi:hypothetical protein